MAFTCGLRITCSLCGAVVCANPDHPEYVSDPHEAMSAHKYHEHPTTERNRRTMSTPLDGFEVAPTSMRNGRASMTRPSVTLNKGFDMHFNFAATNLFGPLRWVKLLYNPNTCQIGFQPADEKAEGAIELKPADVRAPKTAKQGFRFSATAFARKYNVPAGTRWNLRGDGIMLIGDLAE